MKIQCDVCEKAQATVICCADEAALCTNCDMEVHAANKLASKHQRLLLECLSNKLPHCDICQERPAFIFCVEDRALFCKECDEPVHSANSRAANHQRFLATGIRVALSSNCNNNNEITKNEKDPMPPKSNLQQISLKTPTHQVSRISSPSWNDLLKFSDYEYESSTKEQLELGEFDWLTNNYLFGEQASNEGFGAAEVPQLPVSQPISNMTSYKPPKSYYSSAHKNPRYEIPVDDDEDFFKVPDLG